MPEIEERVTELEKDVDKLKQAFIEEDYDGHRRAHKALIEDVEARKRLASAIREKTISGLVWAAIVGLGMLLWHGVKARFLNIM